MRNLLITAVLIAGSYVAAAEAAPFGVEEKIGFTVPGDLTFTDEEGATVRLGDLFGLPTVLVPVYYRCEAYCPVLLHKLAAELEGTRASHQVVVISFDPQDDSRAALAQKNRYCEPGTLRERGGSWKFLTGTQEMISAFTHAIGFRYRIEAGGFLHSRVLVFADTKGAIVRYLHGTGFRRLDLELALTEAERLRGALRNPVVLSHTYNRVEHRYRYDLLAALGLLTLAAGVLLVPFFAIVYYRKQKK